VLSQEENELITRVGPGTPMGNPFREYWLPAMLSEELPSVDTDPVRVMTLDEQLIGFRDSNGKVGACWPTTVRTAGRRCSSDATNSAAPDACITGGNSIRTVTASICRMSPR
jgi:phthalate 4,5-dioxygenase